MVSLEKDDFMKLMEMNGKMSVKLDTIKQACEVFKARNPQWIRTASKQEMRMVIISVLSCMDMLGDDGDADAT